MSAFLTRAVSTMSARKTQPIIAIIGATGTGKSDLAVDLASRFNGEIINADAVQMYEGLPIITNKIPMNERKGIKHHLLGSIGLDEPTWTVQEFLPKALDIIEDIRSRQKVPILVGGTHYYTQALLFRDHTIEFQQEKSSSQIPAEEKHYILSEPTDVILRKLREVDPVMANRWHPNDRRKIQRSLEIYLETGKRASETYMQRRLDEHSNSAGGLRFSTLILWPFCEREAHKSRLDNRVEKMLQDGLLDEVSQLMVIRKTKLDAGESVDFTKGIWQSIGFKQFEMYQQALQSGVMDEKELDKLKQRAIEQTQAATRRYALAQLKWIRIKLMNALFRANAQRNLFVLDGTDINNFQAMVINPARQLCEKFLDEQDLPKPEEICAIATELLTPPKEDLTHNPENWGVKTCDLCGVKAATPQLWLKHVESRGHRLRLSKKKSRETKSLVAIDMPTESENPQRSH
ncbi:tRNA dimethylallyltransferase [Verruconis gallopava]|uniref:tRNA dimethylallyltransferase n=1 Tax=Verruconis gallopava TaxID=253628 RepID=A0A0D2AAF1_9PEZI|nr:tRNA dimethylallyltransferase [Verruconis gallopava]KIW03530.1 tRNA dimethylallyltransferase [Verruconis gallopava]